MKNTKLWAFAGVLIMISASLTCMMWWTPEESNGDVPNGEVHTNIEIGPNTPDTEFADYNAAYVQSTRTLTFNGCDVTYNDGIAVFIEGNFPVNIVINSDTTISSNYHDNNDSSIIRVNNPCILSGPGKLTLNYENEKSDSYTGYCMYFVDLTAIGCEIVMNVNTNNDYSCLFASTFYVYDSTITIETGSNSNGMKGIESTTQLHVDNSKINVTMKDAKESLCGIGGMLTTTVNHSVINVNVGIGGDGSIGFDLGYVADVKNSIINSHADSYDGPVEEGEDRPPSYGIYAFSTKIENSKIRASSGDKTCNTNEKSHGFFVGEDGVTNVYYSNIELYGEKSGFKYNDDDKPFLYLTEEEAVTESQDGNTYHDINWDDEREKYMNFTSPYKISFDFKGGLGTPIDSQMVQTGDVITLPECDATLDGKVFYCWSDGYNAYQPGDKYTVGVGTTFYAVYSENAPPTPADSGNDITPIIVVLAVAIATGAILASAYFRKI